MLKGHMGGINALCLLPNGHLASGSNDASIRLWDAAVGAECGRLEGHRDRVKALCPLVDGRLASASCDRSIRSWDVAARTERSGFEVDAHVLCLTAISPNRLAAGDALGRLHWLKIVD